MELISTRYRELNEQLHADDPAYGTSSARWVAYIQGLVTTEAFETILDYGAGKRLLSGALVGLGIEGWRIAEYDPAVPEIAELPRPADLVICTDVLEHIEPDKLHAVLMHLASLTRRKMFVVISTRESRKTLADGTSPHRLVRPAKWWRGKLLQYFHIAYWGEQPEAGLCFAEVIHQNSRPTLPRARVRQPLLPDHHKLIEQVRAQNAAHTDAWGRLRTIQIWQGVDDHQADLQIVIGVLEHIEDMPAELARCVALARKAVLVLVPITSTFPESYWRRLLETFVRVGDWQVDQIGAERRLCAVGAPKIDVQGVKAVGAMGSEERWEQIKANCAKVPGRIRPVPEGVVHDRLAVLACYGPSLTPTMPALAELAQGEDADVISVSGSHDALIAAGVVPCFHIECDPRPHKTRNMDAAHRGVCYLIASGVHPGYFDKLEGHDVRLWHISTPEHAHRFISELGEDPRTVISGGGSVGLRAIPLLYSMGYRRFAVFGMDCSFEQSENGDVVMWAGKHAGKRQDVCNVKCAGREFLSSPVLLTYATGFFELVQQVDDIEIRLYGDGLLQALVAANLRGA
jgi:hypothetical protein